MSSLDPCRRSETNSHHIHQSSVTAALRCHTHATCRKKAAEILKVETREADGTPRLHQHPPRARDSHDKSRARASAPRAVTSRSRIRDDVAHHSDLMSLGLPR